MQKPNDRTGEIRTMNNGLSAKIIAYRNNTDVDIEFSNGQQVLNRPYGDFVRGEVKCPLIIKILDCYAKVTNPNICKETSWLMDIEDLPLLGNSFWCIDNVGYVCGTNKNKTIRLHLIIMNVANGQRVDHKDGNKLDLRKQNLRICTHAENNCNQGIRRTNTTGYKGVRHNKRYDSWSARIGTGGKYIYLGTHKTDKLAAQAYNTAALKYHGAFARLNVI